MQLMCAKLFHQVSIVCILVYINRWIFWEGTFNYYNTVHVGAKRFPNCEKGHLPAIFKIMLPLASEWENIGLCLGLGNFEDLINASPRTEASYLRETLKLWLSRVDPPPTWEELAKAVEPFDPSIAAKVKSSSLN